MDVDKKTRPTTKMLEVATTDDLCKMMRGYRHSPHHKAFLRLLFELPLDVWSNNDLKAEEIFDDLQPEEKDNLFQMYDRSVEHKQNPLIVLILDERRRMML